VDQGGSEDASAGGTGTTPPVRPPVEARKCINCGRPSVLHIEEPWMAGAQDYCNRCVPRQYRNRV